MAENFEFPEQGEFPSGDAPKSEGHEPSNFFGDIVDPNFGSGSEPDVEHLSSIEPETTRGAELGSESAQRVPALAASDAPESRAFPVVMGLLMIGVLMAAVFLSFQPKEAPAAASAVVAAPASASTETHATPAPNDSLAGEIKEIKGQIEGLAAQLKGLQTKIDESSKPAPPVDLKPIDAKISELSKSVDSITPLAEKFTKLDERVGKFDEGLKSVTDDLSSLRGEVKKLAEASAPTPVAPVATPTSEPKPATAEVPATTLSQGTDLFKAGKFKEADEVFTKLQASGPKDARVYYYAALTHGLTTGDWQGETLKIAGKGAALENSGATKASEIDTAFAELPANLKPWIAYFRKLK